MYSVGTDLEELFVFPQFKRKNTADITALPKSINTALDDVGRTLSKRVLAAHSNICPVDIASAALAMAT